MEKYNTTIPLANLLISTDNPRFETVNNQKDAIGMMILDQGDKLLNLASDITKSGLNPSDLPMVIPIEGENNLFRVLEGNRRITALKLLTQPSLVPDDKMAFRKKLIKIASEYTTPIREVGCVVLNENEANHWIELKHTGANDGVGIVEWDGTQTERFREHRGKTSISLKALNFVKEKGNLTAPEQAKINNIAITNLGRLLHDPHVREAIGLGYENGKLTRFLEEQEVIKGLRQIVLDLADKKINVSNIRNKGDRARYIEQIVAQVKPNQNKSLNQAVELDGTDKPNKPETVNQKKYTVKKRSKPSSDARKALIPAGCVIRITEPRLNSIYLELRRLQIEEYPNSASVLFRVFLELGLDTYIKRHNLENVNQDSKLSHKLQSALNRMKQQGELDRNEIKAVNIAVSSTNSVFSIETLHAYIHNPNLQPNPKDIKRTWDNMQKFFQILYER